MLQHDNFSAWIEIEGVPTQEYNIEVTSDSEGPVVTCWIASEEEKTFSVNYKDTSFSASRRLVLSADGVRMKHRDLQPANKRQPSEVTHVMKDMAISATERSPFVFSKITTTDDDTYMHRTVDAKFGEITLSIWSTQRVKYPKAQPQTSVPATAPALGGPIHEKAKKIGGHCISYGQPVLVPQKRNKSSTTKLKTHYWKRVKCLVSFSFKYRPLALLQANSIAPLPPPIEHTSAKSERSPELVDRSTGARPVDTEEVELLRQQLQLIQKRLDEIDKPRVVKRESDAAEQNAYKGRKRVKVEGQASFVISGEVIDLT